MAQTKILKKAFKKILKSGIVTGIIGTLVYYYTRFVGNIADYLALLSASVNWLFLLAAVFLWRIPFVTALSIFLTASL